MGSRFPSHQLSNGLYVSGRPEQPPKERTPTMSSTAVPYTGGDIKKSGELGKMFDISMDTRSRKSGPINNAPSRTGSFGGAASHSNPMTTNSGGRMGSGSTAGVPGSVSMKKTTSGPLNKHGEPMKKASGPQGGGANSRHNSGPLPPVLPTTGLITSGPITSGPLNASGAPRKASGPLDSTGSLKKGSASVLQNPAVTNLGQESENSFFRRFPKLIFWSIILPFVMGFIAGIFILAAVGNPILFLVVVILFVAVTTVFVWNSCWGTKAITGFVARYPDCELRTEKNGQFVKVSGVCNISVSRYFFNGPSVEASGLKLMGNHKSVITVGINVVTCGNIPLESSFQRVPRCVYTSTSLYEYRGWDSKAANPSHRRFTWGVRSAERHVVDFYISDFQSGLRALVKAGSGAKVTPYVDESISFDINQSNRDMSPEFARWLGKRNLSGDDRVMRLKEGYIKEGSTVSVMGVVQRNDNVLMIVPPPDPVPTGCLWSKCVLPAHLEGIVIRCEDSSKIDAIPV